MPANEFPVLDPWQYRLLPASRAASTSVGRDVGPFRLELGEGLPLCRIRAPDGSDVGVLLGHAVDLERKEMLGGQWQVPAGDGTDGPDATALAILSALGGSFLLILTMGGGTRVYPDIAAQIPCVLDVESGAVGSTAFALLDRRAYETRFDRELHARLGVDGEGWFPATLTAHRGIRRLLPGHCLELESDTIRRFWPRAPVSTCPDPAEAVSEIASLVQAQIAALLAGGRQVAMGLTAGWDTRTMLACARPWLDQIQFVTVVAEGGRRTDSVIARRLASGFGLRHLELPQIAATGAQRQQFVLRGGHCYGDANARFHPSVWPLAPDHVLVGGVGGEYAQGILLGEDDTADTRVTPALVCARLGLPAAPEVLAAFEDWISGLPPVVSRRLWNFPGGLLRVCEVGAG